MANGIPLIRLDKPERMKTTARHSTPRCILLVCVCIHRGFAFNPAVPPSAAAALSRPFPLFNHVQHPFSRHTTTSATITSSSSSANANADIQQSPRSRLRQLTGFSLTALPSTLRAATGFSLTAFRATLRAATGISLSELISASLRRILEILSPSLRYFLQPLLVMYYAPLLMVRYWMVGPSRQYVEDSRKGHDKLIDGWRKAVQAAEKASSDKYWPVHLNGVF